MLYSVLNQDVKNWWYHKQLRTNGQTKAARQAERTFIKQRVKDLRLALKVGSYITLGNYSNSLNFAEYKSGSGTQSKYITGIDTESLLEYAKLGIPVLDMRGKSSKQYNLLMNIKSNLSNLNDIKNKIENLDK